MSKDALIKIRVTTEEKEETQRRAKDLGLSMSAYLRQELMEDGEEKIYEYPDTDKLVLVKKSYAYSDTQHANVPDNLISSLLFLKQRVIKLVLTNLFQREPTEDDFIRCSLLAIPPSFTEELLTKDTLLIDGIEIGTIAMSSGDHVTITFEPTKQ